MGIKKLNVYIIHASHLHERRKVIDDLRKNLGKYNFSKLSIGDIVTISEHDPSTLSAEMIQGIVNYTPIQTEDENMKVYNSLIRVLHVNNLSNAMKHFYALSQIAKCEDPDTVHMVLEDDVMFEPRMCMLLDKAVEKVQEKDIVFLGMPNNEPVPNTNTVQLKESKSVFRILPYNDSYFVTPKLAADIVKVFMPIKFYTNIHLNYILETLKVPVVQTVPNLFVDGSKLGMFLSSQIVNNELIFNKEYMFIKSLLGKDAAQVTAEEKSMVDKIVKEGQIANNPDFLVQLGKYNKDILKDYKKAHEIYQNVYDTYQKNGAIVNNESLFLRDYINLHSYLQTDVA